MREVVVVLDNLRSLYNVGSFFRTADGAGVSKIICCGITGTPKNRRLWKVSLGAEKTVAWEYFEDTLDAINYLREQGYQIVGAEYIPVGTGDLQSTVYTKALYKEKVALIMGAEVDGLSEATMQACDMVVHLPMRGEKESLNVAVVGGVLIYHLLI